MYKIDYDIFRSFYIPECATSSGLLHATAIMRPTKTKAPSTFSPTSSFGCKYCILHFCDLSSRVPFSYTKNIYSRPGFTIDSSLVSCGDLFRINAWTGPRMPPQVLELLKALIIVQGRARLFLDGVAAGKNEYARVFKIPKKLSQDGLNHGTFYCVSNQLVMSDIVIFQGRLCSKC